MGIYGPLCWLYLEPTIKNNLPFMKKVVLLCFVLLSFTQVFAQSRPDSIEVRKGFSTVYRQHGQNLTPKQLLAATQSNPEAYKQMKIAKGKADVSSVLGFAGGMLVGWPLGSAIGGGEPNWTLAGVGAGLIAVGIPFSVSYAKHTNNAISIYNQSAPQALIPSHEIKFGFTGNGVGMHLKF
ncbi:hypothetical protein TH63_10330 [Rufibacter radiotolerans]|uniref:Uncharacterized protein n=2 Tax=Rufibacter radiotolerans TaxID=1379910 RepID=A0A0H4W688_9BACT|nr:hypothetical protein TH63_10330 [Rufibacter radiotolerans]